MRHVDKIGCDIGLVQERWPVGKPLVARFGSGLCEVRTTFDKNEYRVFFYVEPAADLALAQRRMKEGT